MRERLRQLIDQPLLTPNYTKVGFKKTRTPSLLQGALQAYFELHRADYAREVRLNPGPNPVGSYPDSCLCTRYSIRASP